MKIQTYDQARVYLESFIRPILFQKITVKEGQETDPLDRFRHLMSLLHNPHERFRSVQVSGTSGKGSTAYLLSHILTTAGYRTGLSISPHLERINERLQISSEQISDERFIELVNRIHPVVEQMKNEPWGEPSYFELLLALAFLYFAEEAVDIAVIEVGIEGKYDATNILTPLLTILTNISLDHTHILGETEEEIAQETVTIIRPHVPLITAISQTELRELVSARCRELEAPLRELGRDFSFQLRQTTADGSVLSYADTQHTFHELFLALPGRYQGENASLAIAASLELQRFGFVVSQQQIAAALKSAAFPGRFERIVSEEGVIILDGAHNPAKLRAFVQSLQEIYPEEAYIFLVAFKKNKDVGELVNIIRPAAKKIIFTEFQQTTQLSMRVATPLTEMQEYLERAGLLETSDAFIESSEEALEQARIEGKEAKTAVVVTGSLYLVGEIRTLMRNRNDNHD